MKPAGLRRIKRAIQLIIENAVRCSICKKEFSENSRAYGGATAGGVPVLVGDCCKRQVKVLVLRGLFAGRDYEDLISRTNDDKDTSIEPRAIIAAVERQRDQFAAVEKIRSDIVKHAGLSGRTPRVNMTESVWMTDDAAWFKDNPTRSIDFARLYPERQAVCFPILCRRPCQRVMNIKSWCDKLDQEGASGSPSAEIWRYRSQTAWDNFLQII